MAAVGIAPPERKLKELPESIIKISCSIRTKSFDGKNIEVIISYSGRENNNS